MAITDKQFKIFARLARLKFSDAEAEEFKEGFEEMISFCDAINSEVEGDTSSIREVGQRSVLSDDLREDSVEPSLPNEKILSNVRSEKGYFAVKRVVK